MDLYELSENEYLTENQYWKYDPDDHVYSSNINRFVIQTGLDNLIEQWMSSVKLISYLRTYVNHDSKCGRVRPIFQSIIYEISNGRSISKKQFDTTTNWLLREKEFQDHTYSELFQEFKWIITDYLHRGEDYFDVPLVHTREHERWIQKINKLNLPSHEVTKLVENHWKSVRGQE